MAFYVPPDSVVKVMSGVPIDLEHEHTLWFANITNQYNYFDSKVVRTFTSVTYTRKNRGLIKVQAPISQIQNCNYMMFKNTGFENKWFYAFILSVDYISNNVSQITFVIDQLQSWFFEMELKQCYVEREHSTTDVAGDNIIPEGLDTGEYIYRDNNYDWCYEFTTYDVVVYSTFSSSSIDGQTWVFTNNQGRYLWGIYTGLNIRVFRSIESQTTIDSLNAFVTQANQYEQGGIVAMIMIPHVALDNNLDPAQISHTVPKITAIDGYTPRNKKLLTAPYVFIEAQNCEGATAVLPQEFFSSITTPTSCQFMITFNITCAPVAVCVPINYKGSEYCYTEALYINNFSQCSYNTDLYKAYMAQSLTAKIGEMVTDGVLGSNVSKDLSTSYHPQLNENGAYGSVGDLFKDLVGGGKYTNSPLNGSNYTHDAASDIASAIGNMDAINSMLGTMLVGIPFGDNVRGQIYSDLSTQYAKSVQAPHNTGGNTPDYLTSNRLKGFWFFHRTIRRAFAEMIDSYFDRYGYATKRTKVPNIHARLNYTYTKTIGCEVEGNIPVQARTEIKNCFNKGITFWTNPANVGDYTVTNTII